MADFLEVTVDKFTFRVAADRFYSREGVWVAPAGNRVRLGVSDFVQQRSGDVAFADVRPQGTALAAGDEFAAIETIKVNLSLASPLAGVVVAANPALETTPEVINQDPYGEGWLVEIEPAGWEADRGGLLDPQAYFEVVKGKVEQETQQP